MYSSGGTIRCMPNIANVLKAEIGRIARKELRTETTGLKKTVAHQKAEIAGLKRRLLELEKGIKGLSRSAAPKAQPTSETEGALPVLRFRAAGMAANRKRLGLSAAEFGLLVGASAQSVYLWERGKAKPGSKFLNDIAELRGIGKREVAARLQALKQG